MPVLLQGEACDIFLSISKAQTPRTKESMYCYLESWFMDASLSSFS